MTDTELAATAVTGLVVLGVGWLTGSAGTGVAGAVVWSLSFARLTADRAARGVRS
ncbi:MAG: hypothetical protein AAFO29_19280 [Actinomycetota bacterium]